MANIVNDMIKNHEKLEHDEIFEEPKKFITDKIVEMAPLYELIKSGEYVEKIGENFFPEIVRTDNGVFMAPSRFARGKDFINQYEWWFTFDANHTLIEDYKSSYMELHPKYMLAKLVSPSLNQETVTIEAIFHLDSTRYYTKYPEDTTTHVTIVESEGDTKIEEPGIIFTPVPIKYITGMVVKQGQGLAQEEVPLEVKVVRDLLNDIRSGGIKLTRP